MKKQLLLAFGVASFVMGSVSAETCAAKPCAPCAPAAACTEKKEDKECALAPAPKTTHHTTLKEIDTHTLQNLINTKASITLLDARTTQYDDGRRIPGAKLLPMTATSEQIKASLPTSKDSTIIVYCSNPRCPASKSLADKISGLGYTNVQVYEEGIDGWSAAGNKVDKVTK